MPRMRQLTDYFDSSEGGEQHQECLIDVPLQDWTNKITIDLQPDNVVQLQKDDRGNWKLATTLTDVTTVTKKQVKKQTK